MKHAKHILRAVALIIGVFLILFILRFIERPDTFGDKGHYRADNIEEQRSIPVKHGPQGACEECHPDEAGQMATAGHKTVECESCHAPLFTHVSEGDYIAAMEVRRVAELCLFCHTRLEGRPANQPQIDVTEHLDDMGAEWSSVICFDCHQPHSPLEDLL